MNGKKLQIILNDEAWSHVETLLAEANQNFQAGFISYSDAINEMLLNSKVDVKLLQLKHTDVRRALRHAAKEGLELDCVIKMLQEIKSGLGGKRPAKTANQKEVSTDA